MNSGDSPPAPPASKQPTETPSTRRGRPRHSELESRKEALLDAALHELLENGYRGVTFHSLTTRAGVSRATIYSWFGGTEGVMGALIARLADRSAAGFQSAISSGKTCKDVLFAFAKGLLTLLVSDQSVMLNRAAMSSPELSHTLLQSGRYRLGPAVESYLQDRHAAGEIVVHDPATSFGILYGLIVQDTQIAVLLGMTPPPPTTIEDRARKAIDAFMALHSTEHTT